MDDLGGKAVALVVFGAVAVGLVVGSICYMRMDRKEKHKDLYKLPIEARTISTAFTPPRKSRLIKLPPD